MAGLKQLNWASEGVGAKAAALVDLSTVAGNKISNPPWVKFQSAGWVNFPSAPTYWRQQFGNTRRPFSQHAPENSDVANPHLGIRAKLELKGEAKQNHHSGAALRYLMLMASIDWHFRA
ncbi:hypothetical protein [Stutzerimonas kunmingensis]|uniref:hypothetical protein n=1 Tax=Stutzerimonas kunmingensis TaxID=1211807 RepID=UPI001FCA4846|nr:hypothetical protein [Stutzerimonas kunmingensis]